MKLKVNSVLFSVVSYVGTIVSLINYHYNYSGLYPLIAAYTIWVTAMVFARVKNIEEFSFDLDDKNISFKGSKNVKKDNGSNSSN